MAIASSSTFGALLRRHRLTAGLTQEGLAERAGISARGVQDLERGIHAAPRPDTVRMLADALEMDATARTELIAAARPELNQAAATVAVKPRLPGLPVPTSGLIGREREVAAVCALLRPAEAGSVRLLTLTGPGGAGKSRLALAVAAEVSQGFPDGAAWVDLTPLRDPALVAPTIARALGVKEEGAWPLADTLAAALADRRLLLVLDNLEHLLPATGFIASLLAAAPGLSILATSRIRLRLRGEREFAVPPLAVPALVDARRSPLAEIASVAAVRLFVERVGEVRPGFALTPETAPVVVEICRRLDGLPLAIELAASRTKVLPPEALLARLQPRLPLLTGGPRDAAPHQQTMRETIAWSYDLLSSEEQAFFRRLAIFAGGFTLDAVETIGGDGFALGGVAFGSGGGGGRTEVEIGTADVVPASSVLSPYHPITPTPSSTLDHITSLLDHSLLRQIEQPGGVPRISFLETIREFGLEQLQANGETEPIQQAHAFFFLDFATRANGQLLGSDQAIWLDRLEAEHDNLRAAFDWAKSRQESPGIALRLVAELWRFWWLRGYHSEGRARAEAALASGDGSVEDRARALHAAGDLAQEQGDFECATQLLEAARAAAREAGNARIVALCVTGLAIIATSKALYGVAAGYHEEALAAYSEMGNEHGIAVALGNLGEVEAFRGDEQRADAFCAKAEALYRKLGDWYGLATTLTSRGKVALLDGKYARAHHFFDQSLAIYRDLAAPLAVAIDTLDLGRAVQGLGELGKAGELYDESLNTFRDLGHRPGIAWALASRGLLALEMDDVDTSLANLGEGLRLADNPEQIAMMFEGVARVATMRGVPERAARMLGARESPVSALDTDARARTAARLHAALDPTILATAQAAGRALSLDQATAEALATVDELARHIP